MADFGDMQLKITADIGDVLTKVEAARAKLNQLVESQQRLKDNISNLNFAIKANEKEIDGLTKKLQGLNTATKEGNAASVQLKTEINNLRKANLGYGQELVTTKKELVATTAQIKVQNGALKEAEKATGGFSGGISKVWGGLRTLANIIPGIGIGGLVALIAGPLVNAFSEWVGSINDVSNASKLLKQINEDAAKTFGGSVGSIDILKKKLDDLTIPQRERIAIAKEYNKLADAGNQIDLTQINNLDLINTKIAAQIKLLKERALAKAAENIVSERAELLLKAQLDFEIDFPEGSEEKIKNLFDRVTATIQEAQKRIGAIGKFDTKELLALIDIPEDQLRTMNLNNGKLRLLLDSRVGAILKNTQRELQAIEGYRSGLKAGGAGMAAAQEDILRKQKDFDDALQVAANLTTTQSLITKDTKEKTVRDVETIADILAKLARQKSVIDIDINITDVEKAKAKIQAIESAIKSLIDKFKLTSQSPIIIDLQAQITDINLREQFRELFKSIHNEKILVPFEIQFEEQQTKERLERAVKESLNRFAPDIKPDPIVLGLDINPQINNDNFAAAFDEIDDIAFLKSQGITKAIQDGLNVGVAALRLPERKDLVNDVKKRLAEFESAVKQALSNIGTDTFAEFGEAIGSALGGGKDVVKGLFDGIFLSLSQQISALGKNLIKIGVEMLIAKKAIGKLFASPGLNIIAGIGLVALAALLRSQIGKSFSGFAEGGRVKGKGTKTSDSIPAMLSDNEYVIKARSVDKFGVKFFDQLNDGKLPKIFSQNTGKVIFQPYTNNIELGKSFEKITSHLSAKTDSAKTALIKEINSSKVELLRYVTTYNNLRSDKVNSFKELTRFVSSQSTKFDKHWVSDNVKSKNISEHFKSDKYFYKDTKSGGDKYVSVSSENISKALKEKEKISITFSAAKNVFKDAFNSVKDYLIKESKSAVSLKVYKGDRVTEKSFAPVKSTLPYYKVSDYKTSDFKAFSDTKKVSDTNTRSFNFIASKLTQNKASIANLKELVTQKTVPAKYFIKESYKELLSGSITKNISSLKDSLKTKESSPALKNIPYTYKGAVPKSLFILPVKSEVFKYTDSNKLFGFVKLLSSKVLEDVHTTYAKIAQVKKEGGRNLQTDLFRFSKVSLNDKASNRSFVSKITSKDNSSKSFEYFVSTNFKDGAQLSTYVKDLKSFKSELTDRLNDRSENNTFKERFNQLVKTFSDKLTFSNKLTASIKDTSVSNTTNSKDRILYNFKSLSSFAKKDTELIKSLNSAKEVYSAKDSKESLKNIVSSTFEKLNTKYFQSSEKVNGFSKELYKNLKVSDTLTAKYFINNSELKSILSAKAHFSKDSGFKEVYSLKNTGLKVFEKLTKYFTNHSKLNTSFHFKSILSEKGANNFFHTTTAKKRFAKDNSFSKLSYINTSDKNHDKNFNSLTKILASTINNTDKKTSEKTTGKNNTNKTYEINYLRSVFKDRLEHLEHSKEFSRLNFQPSNPRKETKYSSVTVDRLIVSSLKSSDNVKEQTFSNKIVSTFSNFIEKISSNKLLKYASGGFIQGPGTKSSDSVLIRASKGEYVIRAAAIDKYGVGLFDRLNAGLIPTNIFNKIFSSHTQMKNINMSNTINKIYNNLPRFATGGLVGGSGSQPIISNLIAGGFKFKHTFSPIVLRGKDLMTQIDRSQISRSNNS